MLTKDEVKKLSVLARIPMSENDIETMTSELSSILDYVGQVEAVSIKEEVKPVYYTKNVLRQDTDENDSREYTEDILKQAPKTEKDYLVVQKILPNN